MQIIKYILIALYVVNCLALLIVTIMQNKDSNGASGTIVGSSTNNFYEKNKGRTHEGKLKKCVGWQVYQSVVGQDFADKAVPADKFVMLDEKTTDINTPEEYEVI